MFSLTIVFGPQSTSWTLMYKERETAEKHRGDLINVDAEFLILTDDFGQEASFSGETIHGIMLEDMEQSKLAHIERALHQARTQAQASNLAESDPVLRTMRTRHQTPMIQPMPGMMPTNGRGYPG